ncbi:glycosyltransferase family 2 protein [Poseidonocella sp. HB161398]|uniref:glycosyltransferase family 2 protein n=1 Tax=Poseidonocella sp. HB161398 TaxID=2320855 RepID=UPI00110876D2|nr:glycosyltransferase family 2 protein [Poseidonocella sp. HB161398]
MRMDEAGGSAPRASILIAAWSAEKTLDRAISSALAQSVPVEVIVIDDASPDGTAARAAAWAASDPRVRLIRQARNMGPGAARNCGLDAARAPWVTVLDADDFFASPDRIAHLLEIAASEGADFVADDLWKVDAADPEGPRTPMIGGAPLGVQRLDAAGFIAGNLSSQHGGRRELGFLKPLMNNTFLRRHGIRYDPDIRLGEDYVLYAQALIAGARFILTDAAGYVAVVRPESLSGSHPTEAHEHLIAADRALLALPAADLATRRNLTAHMREQQKKWAWRRLIDAKGAGDLGAAARCFHAPAGVIVDLVQRLCGEAAIRLRRRVRLR